VDPAERYGPVRAAQLEAEQRSAVRHRALRRLPFVAALPVAAVAIVLLGQEWARARGWTFGRGLGIAMGLTGVPLLGALSEAVTGIEVRELARRWDALAGWQRGVIGVAAVVVALALFLGIALTVAVRLAG